MHFNISKTCIPWYAGEGDEDDVGPDENKSGNVWVRRENRGHMIEEYNTDKLPIFKQGQT